MTRATVPYWQSTKCSLKKRGVRPAYTKVDASEAARIIDAYNEKISVKGIAATFGRHEASIYKVLKRGGIVHDVNGTKQRKYVVNHDYFDVIDTEKKAYFLGFAYADGYNCESRGILRFLIAKEDSCVLRVLLNDMDSDYKILYSKSMKNGVFREYADLSVRSRRISESLSRLGCVQKKTFAIRIPEIKEELMRHFFRGYFDGDGCFHASKIRPGNMSFTITSNKIFLKQMQKVLIDRLGLNETKIPTASKSVSDIGVLTYCGKNNILKIRDWMYDGASVFLSRKREKMYSI
jgi:hypothetical protein